MKVLKWIGIVLGGLIGIIVVAALILHFVGRSRLNNAPDVVSHPVTVVYNAEADARGKHLVDVVSSCRLCHGDQLEGQVFFDGELGMYIAAPNLTTGKGGIGGDNSAADWELALRHSIGRDGRVLVVMPSNHFAYYSDADLGAMIAYLQSVPPMDNELDSRRVGFPGSVLGGVVGFNDFTRINIIDHANVGAAAPAEAVTADYGQYLVSVAMCGECHGPNLAGITGGDGPPPGPNLTPGGELRVWSEADFITALRTGTTPSGSQLNSDEMPWETLGQMTDMELQAIWTYLQNLPARPTNSAG